MVVMEWVLLPEIGIQTLYDGLIVYSLDGLAFD